MTAIFYYQMAILRHCYKSQHGDFTAHDGGWICLRADHPVKGPNRSADLLNPPGDNGGRYPPYDTAHGSICPCAEKGTCAELFLNHVL